MKPSAAPGLLALVACQPVVYELHDSAGGHGGISEPVPTTISSETDSWWTEPPPPSTVGPPETCFDGGLDGGETDIDCGGVECPACPPGGKCERPEDCITGSCVGGVCGEPPQCFIAEDCAPDPCRDVACEAAQCVYVDLEEHPCDDGDPCTDFDTCFAGECTGEARDCGEFDGVCRFGFCNPSTGNCAVELAPEGTPCDDWQGCGLGGFCVAGECVGKPGPGLFTDFNEPLGWQLDPPWEVGPAAPSFCDVNGADDPAEDHSPGPENLLAGVVLGGCLPQEPLAEDVCLTSPPIELPGPEPVALTYWSRLSAAPVPMHAHVDVWSGQQWETLFEGEPMTELEWTMHVFDLTPFVNPGMMIRFCHQHALPGLPPVAGWSVDDVFIGAPECQPP